MPGWSNSDNKFGLGPYVVGTVLGDGCNYTSIQAAANDAVASGYNVVYVRSGTYTEDLSIPNGVQIIGASTDGKAQSVNIVGSHTASFDGLAIFQYINFSSLGTAIEANNGAGVAVVVLINCKATAAANVFTSSGASGFMSLFESEVDSSSFCFNLVSNGGAQLFRSKASSTASSLVSANASNDISIEYSEVSAADHIISEAGGASSTLIQHSKASSSLETINFVVPGASAQIYHSIVNCSAVSGEFAIGTGTLIFSDVSNIGSAININATVTQQKQNWQPYAETAAAALGSFRGTSSYDSAHFTATDGWVQLVGGRTGIVWTDQAAPTTVTSFSGSFVTASIALTLPAAPAQGDVVAFKVDGAFALTVQANAGQTIKIGNTASSVGGTAVGSDDGDALHLTYRAASSTWIANSVVGNWTLA